LDFISKTFPTGSNRIQDIIMPVKPTHDKQCPTRLAYEIQTRLINDVSCVRYESETDTCMTSINKVSNLKDIFLFLT